MQNLKKSATPRKKKIKSPNSKEVKIDMNISEHST